MKNCVSTSILLSLMLTSGDWVTVSQGKSTTMLATEVSNDTCFRVGRLISVQGKVQLKRKWLPDYHSTAVGAVLCLGDLVRPAKGARVMVQCAEPNQNPWTVPDGVPSSAAIGCRPPEEPIHTITGPITPTRDPLADRIPYIVSPNNTWLLNALPTLRWQPVPGASSYTVRLSGPGLKWETQVSTTTVVYPGEPPLKPVEEGYLLTVEADNGEVPAQATFGLLDGNKATRMWAAAQAIARQNLTLEAKTLAIADLYIGQELIAEAIELLEALVAKESKIAAVYYTLGDLYAQVESLRQAEKNYLKAVELAMTAKEIEGQAAAAARLGEVYAALGNSDKAIRWLQEAQVQYESLGASKRVRALENQQSKLELQTS